MRMTDSIHSRRSGPLRQAVVLGLLLAALVFVMRHLPPVSGHVIVALLVLLVSATVLGVLASGLQARSATEPSVVVIPADQIGEVARMVEDDLEFSANLHVEALSHGFFVSLGPRFMRAYHRTFLESPHAIGLIATARELPVGFLVGALRPRDHASWVLRHRGVGLAVRGAAALAVRPRVAIRFTSSRMLSYLARWRHHRGAGSIREQAQSESLSALLTHMAVVPGARGTGVGSKLVRTFEGSARGAGVDRAILTTLEGDAGAGPFYARLGWTPRGARAHIGGLPMEEWARDLNGEA